MLVLPPELTHAQARASLRLLLEGLKALPPQASGVVTVDASALRRFDSSALAVLLECRRECLQDGKGFAVRGLSPRLRELAQLYGVLALLPDPAAAESAVLAAA